MERANAIALLFSLAGGAAGFYFTHEPLIALGAALAGFVVGLPIGRFADKPREITIVENFVLEPRGVFAQVEEALQGATHGNWIIKRMVREPRSGHPMQLFANLTLMHNQGSRDPNKRPSKTEIFLRNEIYGNNGQTQLIMRWIINSEVAHPEPDRIIREVTSEVKRLVASHTS